MSSHDKYYDDDDDGDDNDDDEYDDADDNAYHDKTSRRGIKRVGISFGSIFLLFSNKSSRGPLS